MIPVHIGFRWGIIWETNGQGTFTWSNGEKYKREWYNGKGSNGTKYNKQRLYFEPKHNMLFPVSVFPQLI